MRIVTHEQRIAVGGDVFGERGNLYDRRYVRYQEKGEQKECEVEICVMNGTKLFVTQYEDVPQHGGRVWRRRNFRFEFTRCFAWKEGQDHAHYDLAWRVDGRAEWNGQHATVRERIREAVGELVLRWVPAHYNAIDMVMAYAKRWDAWNAVHNANDHMDHAARYRAEADEKIHSIFVRNAMRQLAVEQQMVREREQEARVVENFVC